MVFTRSRRIDYTVDFPDVPRPVRSNQHPISKYYAHLESDEKSILIKNRSNPVNQRALNFNWFLRRMVPFKRNDEVESFEDLFSQVKQNFYPNRVRRQFKNDRRRKWDTVAFSKADVRPFYEEIYGLNRFFHVIADEILGQKVTTHENLCRMHGSEARFRSMQYLNY